MYRDQETRKGAMREGNKEAYSERPWERREVGEGQLQLRIYEKIIKKYVSLSANCKHEKMLCGSYLVNKSLNEKEHTSQWCLKKLSLSAAVKK